MTIHSGILAWRISWTEEPSGLQFTGSQRIRHSWATNTRGSVESRSIKNNSHNNIRWCYRGFTHLTKMFSSWWASLVAQLVKNPSAVQEIWARSLDQEDPLEKGMATYSSILAWRILRGKRSLVGHSPWGRRVRHSWATNPAAAAAKSLSDCVTP